MQRRISCWLARRLNALNVGATECRERAGLERGFYFGAFGEQGP